MKNLSPFHPIFLFSVLMTVLNSCSFLSGSDPDPKNSKFKIEFSQEGWSKIDPEHSDAAYRHSISKSILVANSTCKKYDTTTLENLADNLFAGIEGLKVGEGQRFAFAGREAYKVNAEGKMDGVPIFLLVVTLKRDECIYDFSLVSPDKKAFLQQVRDFDEFLQAARFE